MGKDAELVHDDMRKLAFWRNLTIYFIVSSWLGHLVEISTMLIRKLFTGKDYNYGIMRSPLEPYTIYGVGAVACILLLTHLPRKINQHIILQYVVNTLVCAVVEYVCALTVVWRFGANTLWNYSDRFMNLNGYICLQNTLLFGLLATAFIRFVYPYTQKILYKSNQRLINAIFWILLVLFVTASIIYLK